MILALSPCRVRIDVQKRERQSEERREERGEERDERGSHPTGSSHPACISSCEIEVRIIEESRNGPSSWFDMPINRYKPTMESFPPYATVLQLRCTDTVARTATRSGLHLHTNLESAENGRALAKGSASLAR